MSITAAPVLTAAGLTVNAAPGAELVAVGELRITWGRGSSLEAPTPATASVTVRDTSRGATFARRTDLIGQPVVLEWTGGGRTRPNFRGRITDVSTRPRRGGGYYVQLAASSAEAELANYRAPAGTQYPAETFATRIGRLRALLPAALIPGGVAVAAWQSFGPVAGVPAALPDSYTAAPVDASGRSVLDMLREVGTSLHPTPLLFDPVNSALLPALRRRYTARGGTGPTTSARLIRPTLLGPYVPAALPPVEGGLGVHLDAQKLEYAGSLDQPLDARITAVELSYYDAAAAYGQRTVTVPTAAGPLEGTIGRRVLSVSTIHADAAAATALARLYADIVDREGSVPRLGALGYSTAREPFADVDTAEVLLAGCEQDAAAFVRGSWLPRLGQRPMVGFIGGTIAYRLGEWHLELTPAPVVIDPRPGTWAPLTIATAATSGAVRLRDIDPGVTLGDVGFLDVGAGFTAATAPAYQGNPA